MPRKKATSSKTKKPSAKRATDVRKGKKNGDATKRIRGTLLLEYRAVSAEFNECRTLLTDCITRLAAEKAKPVHAPLVELLNEHQEYIGMLKRKVSELSKVQEAVGKKLGVTDLKTFFGGHVIDLETGVFKPDVSAGQ